MSHEPGKRELTLGGLVYQANQLGAIKLAVGFVVMYKFVAFGAEVDRDAFYDLITDEYADAQLRKCTYGDMFTVVFKG